MAEETSSNVTGPTQKPITPMGSRLSDHSSLMITTVKLDGRNYLAWSQSARMFIGSRRMSRTRARLVSAGGLPLFE